MSRRDWRDDAVCRTVDAELFFPVGDRLPARLQAADAKAICRACPVHDTCLDWALGHTVKGIWGGLDEHERLLLKRRVARAAGGGTGKEAT